MIHPDTQLRFIDPCVGWGVFATADIPRGTVTWVRDVFDQTIDPAKIAALGTRWQAWSDHHTFADADGRRVLCWDLCRSMNHACRPNCAGTELGLELAITDIYAGEQLTNDYSTLNIEPVEGFVCRCGAAECRGQIGPDLRAATRLRASVLAALELELERQPLASLLGPRWRERALTRWRSPGERQLRAPDPETSERRFRG